MCFSAGLAVPWGSTTHVYKSPLSQIASLTQTYDCVGVCSLHGLYVKTYDYTL